ncbi:hypothetical protein EVAR_85721_1 [Eumeta japonica]|uniref:Uncharacterized protein n=1 Tax=Eumeta variegata TaxID=151549 RepID=A0A4C1Y3L1_EUMVA|nr:hypothetical protein EVAR_85721_1 [Eumeta japonica]
MRRSLNLAELKLRARARQYESARAHTARPAERPPPYCWTGLSSNDHEQSFNCRRARHSPFNGFGSPA